MRPALSPSAALLYLLLPLLLLPSLAHALFRDEAYHVDFQHALLGLPLARNTFFHQPTTASKASLLYTLSEKLVLGAVNPKDGALVWRQDLAARPADRRELQGSLRAARASDAVVSAAGSKVAAWDAATGRLIWERDVAGTVKSLDVLDWENEAKDAVVATQDANGTIRLVRLRAHDGEPVWTVEQRQGETPLALAASADELFYVALAPSGSKGYKIRVATVEPKLGIQIYQVQLAAEAEVAAAADAFVHVTTGVPAPVVVWADAARKTVKANVLGSMGITTLSLPTKDAIRRIAVHAAGESKAQAAFLVHYQTDAASFAQVYGIKPGASTVHKIHDLPAAPGPATFAASVVGGAPVFTRVTPRAVTLFSATSPAPLSETTVEPADGPDRPADPAFGVAEVAAKPGGAYAVRAARLDAAGAWALLRDGRPAWARPEGLAGVRAAAWAERPAAARSLVHELEAESHANLVAAYAHRVARHVRDLRHVPQWLQRLPARIVGGVTGLGQDDGAGFGFAKIAVVATERGWVAALDGGRRGEVLWNTQVATLAAGARWDVTGVTVEGQQVFVAAAGGESAVLELETGIVLRRQPPGALDRVHRLAPVAGGRNGSFMVHFDADGVPLNAPDAGNATYLVTQRADGAVSGWQLAAGRAAALAWTFHAPPGEAVAVVASRPPHDPVASIGHARGDRRVLYKYLSPHLLLILTTNQASASLTVHLLDAVAGRALHTATHRGVDLAAPLAATLAEHWLAYTFTADPALAPPRLRAATPKAPLLAVAELYEAERPGSRGPLGAAANVSSLRSPVYAPHVVASTHVLPAAVARLATTASRQGITPRLLLAYAPAPAALFGIPMAPLSPRRPRGREPSNEEKEEGLMRESASLELFPQWSLSHAREVLGVEGIVASPARVESSGLVLAFGELDVFGTRESPIGAFDVLGKGFGRGSMLLTVLGLAAGTVFLGPMVRKKQVTRLWGG